MNQVEFNEEKEFGGSADPFKMRGMPVFVRWIISMGLAKTERQANYILLTAAIIIFIIAAYLYFR